MNARMLSRSSAEIDLCRPLNSNSILNSEFGSLMTIEIERSEVVIVLFITHRNGPRES
jgi:hypothetical protein